MVEHLRNTRRQLPVFIGEDQKHAMASAEIVREPNEVVITIVGTGLEGQLLADFLEQAEPIGLTFIPIPVRNIREKRENT